jgi:hypothetical protein
MGIILSFVCEYGVPGSCMYASRVFRGSGEVVVKVRCEVIMDTNFRMNKLIIVLKDIKSCRRCRIAEEILN